MQHDYKAALVKTDPLTQEDAYYVFKYYGETIRHALRIADALMREPSEAMITQLIRDWDSVGGRTIMQNYYAMRDQLLKEVAVGYNLSPTEKGTKAMRVTAEMLKEAGWVRVYCLSTGAPWWTDCPTKKDERHYSRGDMPQRKTFHEAAAIYKQQRENEG